MAIVPASVNLEGRRIAVTGATGFIGRALCAELVRSGANVTALLRSRHGQSLMSSYAVKAVVAPLVAGQALNNALCGHDTLINLAYDIRAGASANLAAFDATLSAATQAGVSQIIHVSSVVVYDDWPGGDAKGHISEASPSHAAGAHGYRAAKIEMERQLQAQAIPATILQPTIVYGSSSEQWTLAQIHALWNGGIVLPDPCGACALVHVDDVVQALLRAAALAQPMTDRFLISGPETPGWDRLFSEYARIAGAAPPRKVPVNDLWHRLPASPNDRPQAPSLAARAGSGLRQIMGRQRFDRLKSRLLGLSGSSGPVWPDATQLALYSASPLIDVSHARYILGYIPETTLKHGLETIVEQLPKKTPH